MAFGIKIDVSNPSLLLIILGVVMMITPKFIPRPQETENTDVVAAASGMVQEPATGQPQAEAENQAERQEHPVMRFASAAHLSCNPSPAFNASKTAPAKA